MHWQPERPPNRWLRLVVLLVAGTWVALILVVVAYLVLQLIGILPPSPAS